MDQNNSTPDAAPTGDRSAVTDNRLPATPPTPEAIAAARANAAAYLQAVRDGLGAHSNVPALAALRSDLAFCANTLKDGGN